MIGASLSEPQLFIKNGMVVSAQKITVKNGSETHHCSFGRVVQVQTSTINSDTSNKCIVGQKFATLFTDIRYKASMVNLAIKNEAANITDIPYKGGTVNYATKNEAAKLLIYFGHMADYMTLVWKEERLRRRREQYRARRDREINKERESRLQARSQPEEQLHKLEVNRKSNYMCCYSREKLDRFGPTPERNHSELTPRKPNLL